MVSASSRYLPASSASQSMETSEKAPSCMARVMGAASPRGKPGRSALRPEVGGRTLAIEDARGALHHREQPLDARFAVISQPGARQALQRETGEVAAGL